MKFKTKNQNCPLCSAANNHPLFENGVDVNTVLGRRDKFLIIPALGPLVVGHVLVITAAHTEGLRYLPSGSQKSYALLSSEIRAYCARRGDTVLEAEHGAREGSVRGPCIRHTHVHVLPGLADAVRIFDDRRNLEVVRTGASRPFGPYLWVSNGVEEALYDASGAIGQEIRRTLGERLAIVNWDWAIDPRTDLISCTKKYWNGL